MQALWTTEGLDRNSVVHALGHLNRLLRDERRPLQLSPLPILCVAVFPQLLQTLPPCSPSPSAHVSQVALAAAVVSSHLKMFSVKRLSMGAIVENNDADRNKEEGGRPTHSCVGLGTACQQHRPKRNHRQESP